MNKLIHILCFSSFLLPIKPAHSSMIMNKTMYLGIKQKPVDIQDSNGNTALMMAVRKQDHKVVSQLLAKKAKLNFRRSGNDQYKGWSALDFAIYLKDIKSVELLLAAGADPNQRPPYLNDYMSDFPLLIVSKRFEDDTQLYFSMAKILLKYKANPNLQSYADSHNSIVGHGMPPLGYAVIGNHLNFAKLLMSKGADIRDYFIQDNGLRVNSLIRARCLNHHQILDLMLNHLKSDPDTKISELMWTVKLVQINNCYIGGKSKELALNFNQRIFSRLKNGASPHHQNAQGDTLLMLASANNNIPLLKVLLKKYKLNPNIKNKRGKTALMFAFENKGHTDTHHEALIKTWRLLVSYGLKSNHINIQEENLLMWAISTENHSLIKELLNIYKINPNEVNRAGDNALIHTLRQLGNSDSSKAILNKLLKAGGNPNLANKKGETTVSVAKEYSFDLGLLLVSESH